ncbi:hypothetical protein Nepgr_027671 [Nepenthes gracilis]|uniref:Transmembrane protein n=1 Tax=Nepenthes gracilis TaxID=150966 RepID=A0AAD3Y1M7_NEPGR|nr:hypothetical protein Nepgr_027671 [Nepenthes gracilis]
MMELRRRVVSSFDKVNIPRNFCNTTGTRHSLSIHVSRLINADFPLFPSSPSLSFFLFFTGITLTLLIRILILSCSKIRSANRRLRRSTSPIFQQMGQIRSKWKG